MTARRRITALLAMAAATAVALHSAGAQADGSTIDRVYAPYVTALERELELRSTVAIDRDRRRDGALDERLSAGAAIGERHFVEGYLRFGRMPGGDARLLGSELEWRWQASEQGEWPVDVGVLLEVERAFDPGAWGTGIQLLAARDFGRWTATVNAGVEYEWGGAIRDEIETAFAAQWRYRWRPALEPAIELYVAEDTRGIGPVLAGMLQPAPRQRLRWEFGVIVGIGDRTPDGTVRALLEYEF